MDFGFANKVLISFFITNSLLPLENTAKHNKRQAYILTIIEMDHAEAKGKSGEDFVNHIAFKTFIKYWCFPGPLDITGDNKEICDLLVVFNHICMIISVKNYAFKGDYERYFKRTVSKAIRQIDGAERKLFRDGPLLLKHPDRDAELFEKDRITEIHRIIINLMKM
jgi:hypothetical protein